MSAETFYVVIDRDGKPGCVGYTDVEEAIAEAKELDYPAVKALVVTDHDWETAREFYVWPVQAVVPDPPPSLLELPEGQTSAAVHRDGETTVVTIKTSGQDLERVRVVFNGGIMFDDFPEFYIDPGYRDCPYCRIRASVLNFCGMCGKEVPWGQSPTDRLRDVVTLTRDITAADLAMDSPGDDGYAATDVIGPAGTAVKLTGLEDNGLVEVRAFANDPLAVGFIPADAFTTNRIEETS